MDLFFGAFETTVTLLAVVIVAFIVVPGESHYLSGVMLVFAYVVIALAFYFKQ